MDGSNPHQRIFSSARGLACSTLSGVAGIEAGLRDPRAPGKQQILQDNRNREALTTEGDRKRRRIPVAQNASASFRSTSVSTMQQEFDAFSAGQDAIDVPFLYQHIPAPSLHTDVDRNGYDRPETWHLASYENEMMLDGDVRNVVSSDMTHGQYTLRSSAVERLDQVQQHMITTATTFRHQQAARQVYLQPNSQRHSADSSVQPVQHPIVEQRPILQQKADSQLDDAMDQDDDDDQIQGFHCPFVDCHRNLEPHRLEYLTTTYGRICIHVECDFRFETKRDWLAHIVTPHHDIQTSMVEDGLQPETNSNALGQGCDCEYEQPAKSRGKFCVNCSPLDPDLYQKYAELRI